MQRHRHRSKLTPALLLTALAALTVWPSPPSARAAGLLVAEGGFGGVLEMKDHIVEVTINNGIAVTHVDQVFVNTEDRQVEALYTFPVPKGASVAGFSMWINGKEMIGEVVEKERARKIYESYKETRRDPGLLEQTDYKTFEMRIFPIAAGAEQRVRISYYQELDVDHDWATYVYPLATVTRQGVDSRVTGRFSLNVQVKSEVPVAEMESPSHPKSFAISRQNESFYEASLEAEGGDLSRDLVLAYHLARPKTGVDLITSKPKGEDGYFMLTLTAGEELDRHDRGMDYLFVLDVSGSMANDGKLGLSADSLAEFVRQLGPKDRFELVAFNMQPRTLFGELRDTNDQHRAEAERFLQSQEARGGTRLEPAMRLAYKYADPDRTLNVVVLSDGMTEQSEHVELLRLIRQRPQNVRAFCIGVGNEVNRPLMDRLATRAGGLAAFLSAGDDLARQARAFRRKLIRPAATDVRIAIEGVDVYDLEPLVMPNLYHGSPVRIYGRYRGGGDARVRLQANLLGRAHEQYLVVPMPTADQRNPEIERMWAWHRIDRLLKDADEKGSRDSVIDQVVALGEGYSIVSEYTSFIVLENDAEYQRWQIQRRNAARLQRDRAAQRALREELQEMRDEALANLGPNPESRKQSETASTQDDGNQQQRGDSGGGGKGGAGSFGPVTALLVAAFASLALLGRRREEDATQCQ